MSHEIEQMIIDGKLSPGEKLDETVLAQKFGISHTPELKAIHALAAIMLVVPPTSKSVKWN